MSLYGALFSGVSGLFAQSQAMGMISDNISNVNTIGYKRTFAKFSTLVTQNPTQTTYSPGGIASKPFSAIDRQGLLQASTSTTDIAIGGRGFFAVTDEIVGGAASPDRLYTRAGSFNIDANGFLVNTSGHYLLGMRIPPGTTAAQLAAMQTPEVTALSAVEIENLAGLAGPTTNSAINANLPATAPNGTVYTNVIQVYDQNGVSNNVTVTFTKTANLGEWALTYSNPTFTSDGTANGTTAVVGTNTITFNSGTPSATPAMSLTIDWANSTTNSSVALDLGTANNSDGLTNFGSEFFVSSYEQNGYPSGNFVGVNFDKDGIVYANYDNGQSIAIYKVPVIAFQNDNGLSAQNGNVYRETDQSGSPLESWAGQGRAGTIAPASLESSTVDLAEEFSNMIITQRAYSAAGKIITTADEMLDELVRLKR